MAGETDLDVMLRTLTVSVRPARYTMVTLDEPVELGRGIEAVLTEVEGTTVVATVEEAGRRGWPVDFVASWVMLDVHSALDAVGLSAAISAALAEDGIPANILAGYFHDHLLVPAERTDDVIDCLARLAERS